jgi:hypothetical protein
MRAGRLSAVHSLQVPATGTSALTLKLVSLLASTAFFSRDLTTKGIISFDCPLRTNLWMVLVDVSRGLEVLFVQTLMVGVAVWLKKRPVAKGSGEGEGQPTKPAQINKTRIAERNHTRSMFKFFV